MNTWSQFARLGAAVAAFGPPILTEVDSEPEQVDMPTLGAGGQPTANVVLEVSADPKNVWNDWDVDAAAAPAPTQFENPHKAALPQQPLLQQPPNTILHGKIGPTPSTKWVAGERPRSKRWHGGGQRYG